MIAKLCGRLDSVGPEGIVVDVGGVGYLLFCSTRTLGHLPPAGEAVALQVETHVREDHIHLYGFADAAERDWFRLLQSVQGVGARLALNILSALSPTDLARAIASGDKAMLGRANGVGARLAQRLAVELKDRVGGLAEAVPTAAPAASAAATDAVSALINLGYRQAEAAAAIGRASASLGARAGIADLIRSGLKELGR